MANTKSTFGKVLRVLAALLVASHVFFTLAIPQSAKAFSGGGAGTAGDPYRITSCNQLTELSGSNEHFLLRGTLNCSSVSFSPIANFTGVFDGRNHGITNINYTSSGDNVGLFATLDGATVKNLSISSSTFTGRNYVATIAGVAYNGATIQNVQISSGNISGAVAIGGLVGEADDGVTIQASSFIGSVTAATTLGGGIAGVLEGSTITNSFTGGVVSGAGSIGGMAGRLSGMNGSSSISNSYSTTTVTNAAGRAGLIGMNVSGDNLSIINNFVAAVTDGAPALFSSTESGTPTITNNYQQLL